MTNGQKQAILTKRALKAKKYKNCSNDEARTYAHKYKDYLLGTELNRPCLGFSEWIKQFQ